MHFKCLLKFGRQFGELIHRIRGQHRGLNQSFRRMPIKIPIQCGISTWNDTGSEKSTECEYLRYLWIGGLRFCDPSMSGSHTVNLSSARFAEAQN